MDERAGLRTAVCLAVLAMLLLCAVQRWQAPASIAAWRLFHAETRSTPLAAAPILSLGSSSTTLCIVAPIAVDPITPLEIKVAEQAVVGGDVLMVEDSDEPAHAADDPHQAMAETHSGEGLVPIEILANEGRQKERAKQLATGELTQRMPTSRAPALTRILDELQRRAADRPDHLTQQRTAGSTSVPPAAADASSNKQLEAGRSPQALWPSCPALIKQLATLKEPQSQHWARRVQSTLDALHAAAVPCDEGTHQALRELQQLAQDAQRIAPSLQSEVSQLLVVAYNVRRRAEIWQAVCHAANYDVEQRARSIAESTDRREMLARIADLRKALKRISHGSAWSEYLMLDQLATFASSAAVHEADKRCSMACLALHKREVYAVTEQQREFLTSPLIAALDEELKRWATSPVDMADLLHKLEEFENKPYARYATQVTDVWSALRWSLLPEYNQIATLIDIHYRNANLRISVTEDFMNRMIPAAQAIRSPVREKILGADVSGQSHSRMHMKVDLVEDQEAIRVRMKADGNLAANTQSRAGSVTLYNLNRSSFMIEKLFIMGRQGIETTPAKASASGRSSLMGLQTSYDPFPIIGSIVRRVATQKAFETRGLQRRIFEDRVARKAEFQVDRQAQQQLTLAEKQLDKQVLRPLGEMELSPTTISMSSTDQRANYRGRLAGDHQLAAFTARPRELPNNMMSIQVHNSAINNLLRQLNLDGQRGELREIIQNVISQFDVKPVTLPDDIPGDVYLALAESDSVRVDCDNDRVSITLAIAELSADQHCWRNFFVRAHYAPEQTESLQCNLAREGPVELQGKRRMSGADDLALRAIFTKVFSKNRVIPLVHHELAKDPRMKDLRIGQFVARDGWAAISVAQADPPLQASQPHPHHAKSHSAAQALLEKIRRR